MTQRRIYQDEYPYFVTWRTREGNPYFDELKYALLLRKIIFKTCQIKRFDLLSYQIMPDHMHLLVYNHQAQPAVVARSQKQALPIAATESRARGYNISQFMYTVKSYTVKHLRDECGLMDSIWQKRFNTRIINTHKYLETVIYYIQNNPEKTGLPIKYRKIPYRHFDWTKIRNLF